MQWPATSLAIIWFDPPSDGAVFTTGQTTTVTACAMDSSGNTGTATFTVGKSGDTIPIKS